MNTRIYIPILALFCIVSWFCTQSKPDNTLAIVENEIITESEFVERYEKFLISTGVNDSPIAREQILNHMVNELLLAKLDNNNQIINSPEYQLKQEAIYRELLLAYYKEKEIYEKIEINDNDLREAFVKVNQQVCARHIYARTLDEAYIYYNRLISGETFEQLALVAFEDDELSKNGGYLGYFTWGDMDPAFEEAAYSLKVGEISKPVKTEYGYSIIRVDDRFQNPILTESEFARKKKSLRRLLGMSKAQKYEREFLENHLKKLKIEINDASLSKLIELMQFQKLDSEEVNNANQAVLLKSSNGEMTISEGIENMKKLVSSNRRRIKSEETLKAALKGIVLQNELLDIAEAKEYHESKEFQKVYDQWVFGELIRMKKEYLEQSFSIADSQIVNYYNKHKNKMFIEEKINLQEILLSSKKEAEKVYRLLNEGMDFKNLAKEYSVRKSIASNGGYLGLLPINRYQYLDKNIKNIPVKKIIGPVKVGEFFVIARIVERENSKQKTLEEARQEIAELIRHETKQQHFVGYIDSLRNVYTTKIDKNQLMAIQLPG